MPHSDREHAWQSRLQSPHLRSTFHHGLPSAIAVAALCLVPAAVLAQTGGPTSPSDAAAPSLVAGAPSAPEAPDVITRNDTGQATVRAVRLEGELTLDGALDEPIYQIVPSISGFIQVEPDAGQPASERTEAWVLFEEDNVYVAARLWDSAPESRWIVNEMRRDSFNILQNENVSFAFDTFYDRRNVVIFNITPIGGRMDGQGTNERNWNGDWNPIWDVRTGRFDGGWSFEARIPFKSLQYRPGRLQVWGFQMRRQVRWKNETSYLTRLDRALAQMGVFQASQAASLVGLEAPRSGRPFEIKPYAIGDLASDRTAVPIVTNEPGGNVGIDLIKYGVTQNLTADFTVNTDFAQVEADEQQVNLTRFSLFFPEKREFFLANQGTFAFGTGGGFGPGGGSPDAPILFYSRQIGLYAGREVPIRVGGRLTGRAGAFTLGLLNIQTGDEPTTAAPDTGFSVARIKRDVLRRSSVGAIFTHRSDSALTPGASNQAYGVDATFAFFDNLSINSYWARTQTTGTDGEDSSYSGYLRYNGDRYGVAAEHLFIDKLFSPEIGFVRRSDMRKSAGSLRFSPRPQSIESVRKFSWEGQFDYTTNAAGFLETRNTAALFGIEFAEQRPLPVVVHRHLRLSQAAVSYCLRHRHPRRRLRIPQRAGGVQLRRAAPPLRQCGGRAWHLLRRNQDDAQRRRRGRRIWRRPRRAHAPALAGAWSLAELGRPARGPLQHHVGDDKDDLYDDAAHVRERARSVQFEQQHAEHQPAAAVGVSAWQRAVRGLQRRAGHAVTAPLP